MGNTLGFRLGRYPLTYNPKVHGPYLPFRYYGPPDTPIWDVKLGELPSWLNRRDLSPGGVVNGLSRYWSKMQYTYATPKYAHFVQYYQKCFFLAMLFWVAYYNKNRWHQIRKYH